VRGRAVVISMVLGCGVLALGACGSSDGGNADAPSTTTVATSGWNQDALATARTVADAVVATGLECNNYAEYNLRAIIADAKGEIPVPLAMTQCKTKTNEDLTFEVFANAAAIDAFINAKQKIICENAMEKDLLDFPGFSYVRGPTWLIEPDEVETADALAPKLDDAASKTTTCKGFAPKSTTTSTTAPS
jgi:hypothetical protein